MHYGDTVSERATNWLPTVAILIDVFGKKDVLVCRGVRLSVRQRSVEMGMAVVIRDESPSPVRNAARARNVAIATAVAHGNTSRRSPHLFLSTEQPDHDDTGNATVPIRARTSDACRIG